MTDSNNNINIFQLKRTIQDITSYKGDWKRTEIFNKYVSDMNKSIKKLSLIEFHFEPFHYSNSGKTINEIGYESLINHISILESMLPTFISSSNTKDVKQSTKSEPERNRIFIVHGRDRTALLETENIVRRIGLEPIVLQRMANNGLTIVEKFEKYSNVRYAIVLLTPDDIGALNSEYPDYKFRARQNVIFELGFFYGKLGRNNVCCINKANIEIPSDIDGIVYLPFRESVEEIELQLMKELKEAKIEVSFV